MDSFIFKNSCCRIECPDGNRGTGFLVAPDLVLTCHHVVSGLVNEDSVLLHFESGETTGTLLSSEPNRDWALVRLGKTVAGAVHLRLSATGAKPGQHWESYGFPATTDTAGLGIKGTIHHGGGKDRQQRESLHLLSAQLGGSYPQGFSGSPVIVGEEVVGMLQSIIPNGEMQPQFGILYACPSPVLRKAVGTHPTQDGPAMELEISDRWTELTMGMPMSASEATRSFIIRYLGTAALPTPFGGRVTELERLLGWADGDGRSIVMLVAPTGRGKSALVCRLVDKLRLRRDVALAFLPVSQRFGTNLAGEALPALLGRLANLYQVPVPKDLSPAVVRAWLTQHLRRSLPDGRRLLLIIDGLDEATDWTLETGSIPRDLSSSIRVLLACRETVHDEADRLRRRLELPADLVQHETVSLLDVAAVQESLRCLESTIGSHWTDASVVARFYTLSDGGDPLLLELLLEELQTESGRTSLLSTAPNLKPGLRGIWDRMVTAQELGVLASGSPSWRLISVLVCALAPLPRDSLVELAELDRAAVFEHALSPLKRWVHETPSGYVFSHSRLREFLYEELLTKNERQQWESCLLQWMDQKVAAVADVEGEADEVPDYVLNCFSAHLQRAEAPGNKWAILLSTRWRRLWEVRPLGLVGLARDVQRVVDALTKQNLTAAKSNKTLPYLREYLRAQLWLSSIRTQATNIPAPLIKRLVESGKWSPAHALAHLEHRLSIDDTAEDVVTVADTVFGILPDELLREGLELALKLVNARSNHGETPWRILFQRAAKIMPKAAALYARKQVGDWHRIMVPLLLAESLPEEEAPLAEALRHDSLACIQKLHPLGLFSATRHFKHFFDSATQSMLLARASQKLMDWARTEKHVGMLRELILLLPPAQQQDAFVESLKIAVTCPDQNEIHTLLDLLDQIDPAFATAGLTQILSGPGMPGLLDWLLAAFEPGATARWNLIAKLVSSMDLRQIEVATLASAKERWRSSDHWEISPLVVLANRGYQHEVVPLVRDTMNEDKRRFGLLELRQFLPSEERLTLLRDALRLERGEPAGKMITLLLEELGNHSSDSIEQIIDGAVDLSARVRGYVLLSGSLPTEDRFRLLRKADHLIPGIRDERIQQDLLLLVFYSQPTVERLDAFLACASPSHNVHTLLQLASQLVEPYRRRVQEQIVDSIVRTEARRRKHDLAEVIALEGFPTDLAQTLKRITEADANQDSPKLQAKSLLASLSTHDETEPGTIDAILGKLRLIQDEQQRLHLAALLLSSEPNLTHLFERATAIQDEVHRFRRLSNLTYIAEARGFSQILVRFQQSAIDAGRAILFHRSLFTRSYVMHRASPEIRREVAREVLAKIEQFLSTHREILDHWSSLSDARLESAYHALSSSAQAELNDTCSMVEEIGSALTMDESEGLWHRIPRHWLRAREVLLPLLSESTRSRALLEYQRDATNLDDVKRAGTIAYFASALPIPEQCATIQQALDCLHRAISPDGMVPQNTCVVLSQLALCMRQEHLPSAVVLAKKTWPTAYNNLHIFLLRLPKQLRLEAMSLLDRDLDSLPTMNRAEVDQTLRLFRIDRTAAVALLEWEMGGDRAVLDRLVQSSQSWTESSLLKALDVLRSRTGGVRPERDQEVEFQLMIRHLPRIPTLRRKLLELVHGTLSSNSKNRSSLLTALNTMAPTLRALTDTGSADGLTDEILQVQTDWP